MYKLFNGLAPSACNVFEFNSDSYNFRDTTSSVLKVPHPNTELFKKSFRYSGSVLWNTLPADVRDAFNFNNFKFMFKKISNAILVDCTFYVRTKSIIFYYVLCHCMTMLF